MTEHRYPLVAKDKAQWKYGPWCIEYRPKPILPTAWDFDWWHDDFDGAPDAGDTRRGSVGSLEDCLEAIHEWEDDQLPAGLSPNYRQPADGYATAFYELAALMGIPAQARSPKEVWDSEMLPRLKAALACQPATEGLRDDTCGSDERLSS
ncbi:hypothetical protein [Novosphingobium sp. JCM 18896]|uniref:hypothetical protein n=1 Tax=Novosphingobium sp. JCM 18896 TaxID=2989731 RepID=UPI0022213C0E|nr:hypothetical protein [Novosphingobium sp. JCM 18896]MCW1431422.1 hypothetical protein [Novosphingobium sp. JCM 18896]